MTAKTDVPPKQSVAGQLFDVAFLLWLCLCCAFLPLWLKIAVPSRVEKLPEGVSYSVAADGTRQWTGLSWEKLGRTRRCKLSGKSSATRWNPAAEIITQPFDYTIDTVGALITAS